MDLTRVFDQLGKDDAHVAGGKGASLGEMTQAGIPVPPGFVILSNTFEHFLDETDLNVEIDATLATVDHREMHTVERASEKIQALILAAKMPDDIASSIRDFYAKLDVQFVAVRSSATAEDSVSAAWAGQLDSYLNTTEETLLKNVQRCWASLFTPRAIFYRFEKGLHTTKISVAVVVQKMVQSEVSGIAFSVHPVTEDHNQLIIEAGFGLGEAIVSGSVTPDSYVVEKNPRRLIEKNINYQTRALWRAEKGGNEWHELTEAEGSKPALSDAQALELAEIVLHIENHYGFPCDIEWAYEAGQFFITQSRPITTLAKKSSSETEPELYSKFFSRDFSLAAVEIWWKGETVMPKEWTNETQPHYPFIAFERHEGTVSAYYNLQGVKWVTSLLLQTARKDKDFLDRLARTIPEKLADVRPLYEHPRALPHSELVAFMKALQEYYPWFEAMWWLMELSEEELDGLGVEELREIRKQTNELSVGTDEVIRKSCAALLPEVAGFVHVLTTEEIEARTVPELEELKKRDAYYVYTANRLHVGMKREEVEREYNIILEQDVPLEPVTELKGTSAQPGVVRGKVRRVMGRKSIPTLLEGEILVSPMTMPDFLPAMKKAAAFVTDEGGITCHAAIVAREMRKPCVVGAKYATQVLKDGDMVEVDADKGVVKIIKT